MRREGRLHGYEFDREEAHKRVKACNQPTNRSKFRSKHPQEKAGRPRYKALKKMKGHRNKAHASDIASNHKLHEWALHHTRCAMRLADSLEEPPLDPIHHAPLLDALSILLLSDHTIPTQVPQEAIANEQQHQQQQDDDDDDDADADADANADADADEDLKGSDWSDLGSTDGSDNDDNDDWFLC